MLVFHIFQHGGISSLRLCDTLDPQVKTRYLEKISCVEIDPLWLSDKKYDPECLLLVESMDLLLFLVLDTSYYSKDHFKAYRNLQDMVVNMKVLLLKLMKRS